MTPPHLYLSRRRMLNRLSFDPQPVSALIDPSTDQTAEAARTVLLHLEEMGLADEVPAGWKISDEGVAAMAFNGIIFSEVTPGYVSKRAFAEMQNWPNT